MTRQFKPVRLTVLIGVTAIIVCGFAVFYTHRSAHGTTAEERAAYEIGEKAGEKAQRGATLPAEAELNMTAQKYFEQQGPAEQLQNPTRAADLQALKRLSKRVTPPGSRRRMRSGELLIHRKRLTM
jgi:hypothetical protein